MVRGRRAARFAHLSPSLQRQQEVRYPGSNPRSRLRLDGGRKASCRPVHSDRAFCKRAAEARGPQARRSVPMPPRAQQSCQRVRGRIQGRAQGQVGGRRRYRHLPPSCHQVEQAGLSDLHAGPSLQSRRSWPWCRSPLMCLLRPDVRALLHSACFLKFRLVCTESPPPPPPRGLMMTATVYGFGWSFDYHFEPPTSMSIPSPQELRHRSGQVGRRLCRRKCRSGVSLHRRASFRSTP